ncbi:MAG TPA: beta-propeller fold lactonase family protein [Verrucomicrobiae bacterium]|nr:beta-propeller fold lactonase family protein [Verrucomicrobiae bacterium]
MSRVFFCLGVALLLLGAACSPTLGPSPTFSELPQAQTEPAIGMWPGRKADGSVLLPNQWSLHPVGRQVPLADFPINVAVHPGGRFAAVLHSGYSEHQILVVDLSTGKVIGRVPVHEAFYGLAFSLDGKTLVCSGAGDEVIHVFTFQEGKLSTHPKIQVREPKKHGVPAGLALDRAARYVFAADLWGNSVSRVALHGDPQPVDILLGTNLDANSQAPIQPSSDPDTAAAQKRAQAALYEKAGSGTFPYACCLDEARHRLYVSLWAAARVAVIDLNSMKVTAQWPTQDHPCEMALTRSGKTLFVANASRNTVSVFDTKTGKSLEVISSGLYPNSPPGSTPNSLALSPDERTLFVANADNNTVALFDVSTAGKSRPLGFIPVGWYPTSVRVTPDGKQLVVANGKGIVPLANPLAPQPGIKESTNATQQYIGRLLKGSLSIIDLPSRSERDSTLTAWTRQAYQCSPLRRDFSVTAPPQTDNPIPLVVGGRSPIKYCLYIIKENRTYDQILGDMKEGNGDPKLCLFGEHVTPNLHQIARDFVLLDSFYVDGEVSADGHEWSMGAYATDFVEKMWPLDYGHNKSGKFPYPSEGTFAIATPAGGYLWDRAKEAGISYRSYGEFIADGKSTNQPGHARVKGLEGHFDEWYRSFDLGYPDVKRAERFISELKRFEKEGDMPQLQILRLPNDHTHGGTIGVRTPTAYIADNDLAMGMVIEALSHSKFWPEMAIFVVEDDAQNGPDHVDAHRTTAFVISPYARRGAVDSTLYSTSSMLRTMELILGLKPMSQFDAAARPMYNAFQSVADLKPYQCKPANENLDALNSKHAWGGRIKMNFTREDAVDDLLLNEVVWRSVRGPNNPMPAPVRAAFVFPHPKEDADD